MYGLLYYSGALWPRENVIPSSDLTCHGRLDFVLKLVYHGYALQLNETPTQIVMKHCNVNLFLNVKGLSPLVWCDIA